MKPIRIILTGATGMVGEGVMHECLLSNEVSEVLLINRKSSGHQHPKLKELVHQDLFDLSPLESQLSGYDACLFCLGTTSVGKDEATYTRITYDLTMHIAATLSRLNPQMVFEYVSGAGTDSTEKGKVMWARVKGKTENDLSQLGFSKVYHLRPGVLLPTKGLKNTLGAYKYLGWLAALVVRIFPGSGTRLSQLGQAMLRLAIEKPDMRIIEVKDIRSLSKS